MAILQSPIASPGLRQRIERLLFERHERREPPDTLLALAKAAGISRQTLATALKSERISGAVAERVASALGVPVTEIAPEIGAQDVSVRGLPGGGSLHVSAPGIGAADRVLRSHRVRVWLADFRAELTKARATDEEIDYALRLLTSSSSLGFFSKSPAKPSEEEVILALDALAVAIRAELKRRGRKLK